MSAHPKKFQIAGLIALLVLGIYFSAEFLAKRRVTELQTSIENRIVEQRQIIVELSEIAARSGADETTESIVRDCSVTERNTFEALLAKLDESLPQTELQALDQLFGRCGYFFAQRKSFTVARLTREVELYSQYVTELENLTGTSLQDEYSVEIWHTLAQEEKSQSDLFMNLVRAQDNIITTLKSGKSPTSDEIKTILAEVKETQDLLSVTSMKTADVRSTLVSQ